MPTEQLDHMDLIFKALASKPRRDILLLLASGAGADEARCCTADEVCACVFAEKLSLTAPTVSHHMKALTEAGLITSTKRGLWVYYRLVPESFEPLLAAAELFARPAGVCDCADPTPSS
ncbi:MAG: helix-turn-helix transcriptional regulator [Coriobacteriia bacterium]|nr:helix-turn-helix transcriptional regulator [Coriobacteriia bacterium]